VPLQRGSGLQTSGKKGRCLRILLLAGSDVRDNTIDETLRRIGHFTSLSGAVDVAIIFLLQDAPPPLQSKLATVQDSLDRDSLGVLGLAKLQSVLIAARDVPSAALLPTVNLEGIPKLVKDHARALGQPLQVPPPQTKPIDLLAVSSVEPAMSPAALSWTRDIFSSFKELGQVAFFAGTDNRLDIRDNGSSPHNLQSSGSAPGERLQMLRDQIGSEVVDAMVEFWIEEWTTP